MTTTSTKFESKYLLNRETVKNELGVSDAVADTYVRLYYRKAFGIRSWFKPPLAEHSFPSAWISINYEETKALLTFYKSEEKTKEEQKALELTEDGKRVENLIKKLDELILEKGWDKTGFFIKLDTRSPKDAHLFDVKNERLHNFVTSEFNLLSAKEREDKNLEMLTFVKAANKALRFTSGAEAIHYLTHSMRVRDDFNVEVSLGEKLCDVYLILREWRSEVVDRPQYEFRGFAHNKSLNALTQYFGIDSFPDLLERKDEIERLIREFFDRDIKPFIEHESFVIDFYVTTEDRVLLIELNPFYAQTGAGCFNWKEDRETFMHGPFEFRVIEECTEHPDRHVPPVWRREIDRLYHGTGKSLETNNKVISEKENEAQCVIS